jgi:Spy/CpxP family protein refolding chaperone
MVKTWQVALATLAIFVSGLVTGGAAVFGLMHWVAVHRPGVALQFIGRNQVQQFGPQLMRSFEDKLELTDEQRAQIEPIVKRAAAQLGRERREVQLTSAIAIEKMQDEIAAVLTPEQRTKFEALIARQRERLQQFRRKQMQEKLGLDSRPAQPGDSK